MSTPPTTWADVPAAVRAGLEKPFTKAGADGIPGLSHAADVLGWRAGDINANWGGPRPVTNALIGAALGSLGGYGVGRLAEQFLPERYFDHDAVRRRALILGGALGATPGVLQGADNIRVTGDPASVFSNWPAKQAADMFDPFIPRDAFNAQVMNDPFTPMRVRAATAGLVEAADAIGGNRGFVSPWEVARVAVGAGAGLVSGVIAGKALGFLAGLTPEAQQKIQQVGLWSGVVREVVPQALGFR